MEEDLYKGILAYLRHHLISDVPREVWGARRHYTNNGHRNGDGAMQKCFKKFVLHQKCFKKFALHHTLRGLALFGFYCFFFPSCILKPGSSCSLHRSTAHVQRQDGAASVKHGGGVAKKAHV
jgi:hypothetical protein